MILSDVTVPNIEVDVLDVDKNLLITKVSSIHQRRNPERDCYKLAQFTKTYCKMSLYPSLEDMKVDQMAQAQVLCL